MIIPRSEDLRDALALWREEPVRWCIDVLGIDLWDAQKRIIESVRDNRETAVASCHGAGKSFTAACCALWYLHTHRPSLVLTTAPTDRQVRGVLWKEIRILHSKARIPIGGRMLRQELHLADNCFAMGFTAPDYDADRFQGWHEEHLLAIVDEAAGVSKQIYEGIAGVLSTSQARLISIGNPTDPGGYFGKAFQEPGVVKIRISAFHTPNFTQPGITEQDIASGAWQKKEGEIQPSPKLVTPQWAAERLQRWGRNNPLYQSKVLGQFPESSDDTLIPLAWIQAAQDRELDPTKPIELGVDVARFGSNYSVIGLRSGNVYRSIKRERGVDTMALSGLVRMALEQHTAKIAKVDVCGVGGGVVDRLKEQRSPVKAMNAGSAAKDKEHYLNARAEWFWGLRERFEAGDIDIDPHDEELAAQLASIKWKVDSRGRIVIETKDEMRRRGIESPDDADAMALAFAPIKSNRLLGMAGIEQGSQRNPWGM